MRSDRDIVEALEDAFAEEARPLPQHVRDAAMQALPRARRLSGRGFEIPRAWTRALAVAAAAAVVVVGVALGPALVGRLQQLLPVGSPTDPSCGEQWLAEPHLIDLSAVGMNPQAVATGDLNGDGTPDLVVSLAWTVGDTVAVVLGRGDGTFGAPMAFESVPLYSLATADVDKDGRLDVVAAGDDGAWVFRGDGTGGLREPSNYVAGAIPRDIVIGRFNDDVADDLAIANLQSDEITIHLGDESGAFADAISLPTDGAADSLTAADFNLDGREDLAYVSGQQPFVQVILRGVDGFGAVRRVQAVDDSLVSAGSPPSFVVAADLDLDGNPDLLVGNQGWGGFAVLVGDGLGGFAREAFVPVSDEGPAAAVVADLDGEGAPEIAVVTHDARRVLVFQRNDGNAYALASETVVEPPLAGDPNGPEDSAAITAVDIDGSGTLDLVTSNVNSASLTVLANRCQRE